MMSRFLVGRLASALLLLWAVVSLCFLLLELSPGDVSDHYYSLDMPSASRELIRARWHLDDPAWQRYLALLGNLARGRLGISLIHHQPVLALIGSTLPHTLLLSGSSLLLMYGLGVPLGTWQALRSERAAERLVSLAELFLFSMPSFWLGLVLILLFSVQLELFPGHGLAHWSAAEAGFWSGLADRLHHLVLPSLALGLPGAAGVARYQRTAVLEALGQDYVRTARALGLPEARIVWGHALRNALLPVITLAGISFPFLFSGAVLVENIFAWPGMGRLIVTAIMDQDSPVIIASLLIFGVLVIGGNLLADLLCGLADPRARQGGAG